MKYYCNIYIFLIDQQIHIFNKNNTIKLQHNCKITLLMFMVFKQVFILRETAGALKASLLLIITLLVCEDV